MNLLVNQKLIILHTIASPKRLLEVTSIANMLSHQTFVKIIEGFKKINPHFMVTNFVNSNTSYKKNIQYILVKHFSEHILKVLDGGKIEEFE